MITPQDEQRIRDEYANLRSERRDNKKSIVRTDDGLFLTSVVYTDPAFSKKVVKYFKPQFKKGDTFIDPCAGHGAWFDNLPKPKDWCEIQRGKDFMEYKKEHDWCFANFPWRGSVYTALANHAYEIADNVVSLVKFSTATGTMKRILDAQNHNMGIKEVIFVPWEVCGFHFTDGTVKAPEGFLLTLIHYQRNWKKGTTWSHWKESKE